MGWRTAELSESSCGWKQGADTLPRLILAHWAEGEDSAAGFLPLPFQHFLALEFLNEWMDHLLGGFSSWVEMIP